MKKSVIVMLLFSVLFVCISCGGTEETSTPGVNQTEVKVNPVDAIMPTLEPWIVKGVECYGIVISNQQDGSTIGKPVKCKVIALKDGKVKMKALESVSLMEGVGCDKLGLSYGDTYWEIEGDIYKSRDVAEELLASKGWLVK